MDNPGVTFFYLSQEDVLKTKVGMKEVIEEVETVLSLHDRNEVNLPSKIVLDLGEKERGRINAMPAYLGGKYDVCGIKWISGFPGNPRKHGLPRASAFIILNDSWTGLPLVVMDGTYISAMRTGAVTGVGAKYLANKNSSVAGIIGCGVQAITQIMALKEVLPSIQEVKAYDINNQAALQLKEKIEKEFSLSTQVVEKAQDAVEESDVIVTVTVADEPIVKEKWLKKGSFFAHVGSYQEEEEDVIIHSDKIVVDVWTEVLHRGTPLVAKLYNQGKIGDTNIYANIGEIINGRKVGRENPKERIFFSPMGLGSEDVAVAWRVYQQAREKSLGQKLSLWDRPIFA